MIELTIPELLPSLNRMQAGGHWSAWHRHKNRWNDWVLVAKLNQAKLYGTPKIARARIEIDRYCVQPCKDWDNLSSSTKWLLDAIVRHGILLDDSMEHIGKPEIKQIRCPRAEQRTVVRIYPQTSNELTTGLAGST